MQFLHQGFHPSRMGLDLFVGHPVHPRASGSVPGEAIGVAQEVLAPDLVVEGIEAKPRLTLGFVVELALKAPNPFRLRTEVVNDSETLAFTSLL